MRNRPCTPHCFKNCSEGPARLLVLFTPGGIEGFFDFGKANPDGSAPPEAVILERLGCLAPQFGLEVLGPSPL